MLGEELQESRGDCPILESRNRQLCPMGKEHLCPMGKEGTGQVLRVCFLVGLLYFPWVSFRNIPNIGNILMCFVRILDDNPITRISQKSFMGLNSLFFL